MARKVSKSSTSANKHTLAQVRKTLRAQANPEIVENLKWFFKTGPGEYGEGDEFLGIKAPPLRLIQKQFNGLSPDDAETLVQSQYHEERWLGLLYFKEMFMKGDERLKADIFKRYLGNTKYINGWDLVDLSAPEIVGGRLYERDRKRLYTMARSRDLWKRRIAIMATYYFIRRKDFSTTLELAEILGDDTEDLMHKAVGWMLREVGNRDRAVEEKFLKPRYKKMPRTMLRYAIEKFPEPLRKRYLNGLI